MTTAMFAIGLYVFCVLFTTVSLDHTLARVHLEDLVSPR